jgi:peptidylprolyl isomerase
MTEPTGPPTLPAGIAPVRTPSGLEYFEIQAGSGDVAQDGDRVRVQSRTWLLNGDLVDDTQTRGGTDRIRIGAGDAIVALEEGLTGMAVGGRRRLIVPSDLAYGPRGEKDRIPPYATLIIDLELVAKI